jgi:hypothetical protein
LSWKNQDGTHTQRELSMPRSPQKPRTSEKFRNAILKAAEADYTTCAACRHFRVKRNSVRRDAIYNATCTKDPSIKPIAIKAQNCGTMHLLWYRNAIHCPYLDNMYEGPADEMLRD